MITDDEVKLNGFPDRMSRDFAQAIDGAWRKTKDRTFAEMVHEYRLVEAEFLPRVGENEAPALEMKRRIAEAIFKSACLDEQPFDTCQKLWNELLALGFTDIERTCTMTCFYADCCIWNKQPEEGLQVLEPLLVDLERRLADSSVDEHAADYYRYQLDLLGKRLPKLKALQK